MRGNPAVLHNNVLIP